jgi:hypothetical protein
MSEPEFRPARLKFAVKSPEFGAAEMFVRLKEHNLWCILGADSATYRGHFPRT